MAGGKGTHHRAIRHRKAGELGLNSLAVIHCLNPCLQLLLPRALYGVELQAVWLEATRRYLHAIVLGLLAEFVFLVVMQPPTKAGTQLILRFTTTF